MNAKAEVIALPGEGSVVWQDGGETRTARWLSAGATVAPKQLVVADDRLSAETAYKLTCEGTALFWQGDFQNAKLLLQALARRIDKTSRRPKPVAQAQSITEIFHRYRQAQARRAGLLGRLLLPLSAEYAIPLRRAPDVRQACIDAYGPIDVSATMRIISMRELLGVIGAYEWREKGLFLPALENHIHPHYGVFAPIRGEYLDLVAKAPLPASARIAFDVGTGTGVLAAMLAQRGVSRVVATDLSSRALLCATENIDRLGLTDCIEVQDVDLFPAGRADLVVCNPPWLPGKANSLLDQAVYDPESRMLRGFLAGLAAHLNPGGEGWLILSDLAEHLGLRSREQLLAWIAAAGLRVAGRTETRPRHPRAVDATDPLHTARAAELTSLWRLTGL